MEFHFGAGAEGSLRIKPASALPPPLSDWPLAQARRVLQYGRLRGSGVEEGKGGFSADRPFCLNEEASGDENGGGSGGGSRRAGGRGL